MSEKILEKVHEHLYDNLYLLAKVYPMSRKMQEMLKKDIFVKNNKAAAQEVIYYLLNLLQPHLVKSMITTWPPYDVKRETKFRSEILQCINEIKRTCNVDIPAIMSSHLISPGGFKFAFFIYKLSQAAIYDHLKKRNENVWICTKNKKIQHLMPTQSKHLKILHEFNKSELIDTIKEFNKCQLKLKLFSSKILQDSKSCNKVIADLKQDYKIEKAEFDMKYPSFPSITHLRNTVITLKKNWEELKKIHDLFQESEHLLSHLTSNNLVLEHNGENNTIKDTRELDLIEYFKSLSILCEKSAFNLPNPTNSFFCVVTKKLDDLLGKCAQIEEGLMLNRVEFIKAMEELSKLMEVFVKVNGDGCCMNLIGSSDI